ncbi:hypothetical protein ACOSQ2_014291 [Xanthoceras sorbifolium]
MSNNYTSKPRKILLSYFGKKEEYQSSSELSSPYNVGSSSLPSSSDKFETENVDTPSDIDTHYECDPRLHLSIGVCLTNMRYDVRETYIKTELFQSMLDKYPPILYGK